VPPKFNQYIFIYFCNEPVWLAPQNGRFYFEVYTSSPLAHLYKWKEGNINIRWSRPDKSEVLLRTLGEHVRNLGISLLWPPPAFHPFPTSSFQKACMESEQWTFHSPHQTQLFFLDPLHSMTWLLIGCTEILFLKFGCYYFWPGLIALPKKNPHLLRIRVENWINPSWHIIVT